MAMRGSSWASAHQNLYDFHIAPPIQGHFDPDPPYFQGDVSDGGVAKSRASDGPQEHVAAARPRSQAPAARSAARLFSYKAGSGYLGLRLGVRGGVGRRSCVPFE